jgi:hypothetical protein
MYCMVHLLSSGGGPSQSRRLLQQTDAQSTATAFRREPEVPKARCFTGYQEELAT